MAFVPLVAQAIGAGKGAAGKSEPEEPQDEKLLSLSSCCSTSPSLDWL